MHYISTLLEVKDIKNKIIKLMGIMGIISVTIPANIFVYATSETSYVETVESIITVEDTFINGETEQDSDIETTVSASVAEVIGINIEDTDVYSLVLGEELANFDIVYKTTEEEDILEEKFEDMHELKTAELSESTFVKLPSEEEIRAMEEQRKKEEEARLALEEQERLEKIQQKALLEIENPDESYNGKVVVLSESDRDLLERLVQGEAGGEGMEGAALVAQAIRDTMVYKGFDSVEEVRRALKYSGSTANKPNENVKQAVKFIFDDGGYAVKHSIFYFYAPAKVSSPFHESQKFIIEHGGHKFFSVND